MPEDDAKTMRPAATNSAGKLVVVSNRLPVAVEAERDIEARLVPAAGGLVTALGPVLKDRGGKWVGWLGRTELPNADEAVRECEAELGYDLGLVGLSADEVEGFYEGFANEVLWPLFHDFLAYCNFDPAYWPVYQEVNRKFAVVAAEASDPEDYLWIHDYHLMLVARELDKLGIKRRLAFFLHIPFPPPDMFVKMPWREQIIEGLLHFGLVGFQTTHDLDNFLQCVQHLVKDAEISTGPDAATIESRGKTVRAGAFPISIDYDDFLRRSVEDPVSELVARVRMQLPNRRLVLGLDRLDYSKGIAKRIRAFGNALERYPELRGKVTLLQVVVPSRTRVGEYRHIKDEIDRLIGMVNGTYTQAGWTPIQYIFRRLNQTELLAYYRACDVGLVTPLRDGMNLVAKEYCACSLEDNGVLILSEFAGAALQLADGALIVNPFDIEAVADAIHQAVEMPDPERRRRMQTLRKSIRRNNIYRWVERFLAVADEAPGCTEPASGLRADVVA